MDRRAHAQQLVGVPGGPYLSPPPKPPPVDPLAGGLGFNLTGPGTANELLEFIQMRRAVVTPAGRRKRVHRITNENKAVGQVATADPEALGVYRVKLGEGRAEPDPWDWQGRRWSAGQWVEHWLPMLAPGIRRDGGPYAITWLNEAFRRERLQFYIGFYLELMRICTGLGIRSTYGDFSVGAFTTADVAALRVLLEMAWEGRHILSGNTYWSDEQPQLFTYMLPLVQGTTAEWIHGEIGWFANDASYQPGQELELAERHDAVFVGRPGYLGGALWCMNPMGASAGDWKHSHFQNWRLIAAR